MPSSDTMITELHINVNFTVADETKNSGFSTKNRTSPSRVQMERNLWNHLLPLRRGTSSIIVSSGWGWAPKAELLSSALFISAIWSFTRLYPSSRHSFVDCLDQHWIGSHFYKEYHNLPTLTKECSWGNTLINFQSLRNTSVGTKQQQIPPGHP